ncbi:MAG TPA: efflux RND transporter permease subunit [Xylella sp.]
MNITRVALDANRLTLFTAVLLLLAGIFTFLDFPSQEEPPVTIRDALISLAYPGMPSEQVEALLAKPTEERLREIVGIKNIVTTVRPGSALIQLTAYDKVKNLEALWLRVRAKAAEASTALPVGTLGPFVNDDFGRVAVASIAITAPGFSMSEMREPIHRMREHLYTVPGVERVNLYGLQEDQVYVTFDRARLVEAKLTPTAVIQQLRTQNVVAPGGLVSASGLALTVTTSGEIRSVEELRRFLVSVPDSTGAHEVPLSQIADIRVMPADPPQTATVYQGQPAVVLAVSMSRGRNISEFGNTLRAALEETNQLLPIGFEQHVVTFQADVVDREMGKMHRVMGETVIIVMAIVMLFLGWRTGLIVGAIVPLTMLCSLIIMRAVGVELHTVSMAAIIMALGLLVDNGIVIAEDIERRIAIGEKRRHACIEAGRTLSIPLLTSSLVIVLAFSPFFFGETSTNEYLRPLVIVLTVTLLSSWLLSITVIPLLCLYFAKAHRASTEGEEHSHYDSRFYRGYRTIISQVLEHRGLFIGSMLALLAVAVIVITSIPYNFLPKSDRLQFQMPITLQPGSDSRQTLSTIEQISHWFADKHINPEVIDSIGYVADGGPRIVLGLNPPLPATNIGYFTISVHPGTDIDAVITRTRQHIRDAFPYVRAEPKRFSLGASEAGIVIYRIIGSDEAILRQSAEQIGEALRALPGTYDVYDNWQARIPRYIVQVDQLKARRAGISSEDIAQALQMRYSGMNTSLIRDDGVAAPIVLRGNASERAPNGSPAETLVYPQAGGMPLPLLAIATIENDTEPSTLIRRNLNRAITIIGHNTTMSAGDIAQTLAPKVASLKLPLGYRVELGGEIEDAAQANQALLHFMPHAVVSILLLFILQFNSFRKLFIVVASIPFVLIGASLALLTTGYPFGFIATFGLLALAGIIVNNAVLLLERIEEELANGLSRREAVVSAAVKRLRPIIMTKLTCIVGLVPLMLFGGPLWTGMAITMIGGLALGTLVTLGLIPSLYDMLFRLRFGNKRVVEASK